MVGVLRCGRRLIESGTGVTGCATRAICPSDLTEAEWALIAPLIRPAKRGGRRRSVVVREVMNGLL